MLSDLDIAQAAHMRPILDVARDIGLEEDELDYYGRYKAKVSLAPSAVWRRAGRKLVLVTAITPTPLGEGKTVTTLGLTQGLRFIKQRAISTIRQPSMGPVFGIKGGAAAAGMPRSCRWRTSTSTSPATSTPSRPRTTSSPRCSTPPSGTRTRCALIRTAFRGGASWT